MRRARQYRQSRETISSLKATHTAHRMAMDIHSTPTEALDAVRIPAPLEREVDREFIEWARNGPRFEVRLTFKQKLTRVILLVITGVGLLAGKNCYSMPSIATTAGPLQRPMSVPDRA